MGPRSLFDWARNTSGERRPKWPDDPLGTSGALGGPIEAPTLPPLRKKQRPVRPTSPSVLRLILTLRPLLLLLRAGQVPLCQEARGHEHGAPRPRDDAHQHGVAEGLEHRPSPPRKGEAGGTKNLAIVLKTPWT